jgi:hypothetical protein
VSDRLTFVRTPGSAAAKREGCTCPVMDNGHGAGAYVDSEYGPQFWITEGCPLHSPHSAVPSQETDR